FSLTLQRPARSTLLPYTTLFRSMVRGTHEQQVEAVKRALDAGITYFDTAPLYGDGLSETNTGAVLTELDAWDQVVLGTKVRLRTDRKSTRLNSSHVKISYAVFCL